MNSILVTGGAGYIGSHTCKALRQAGFEPVTYDNLARGNAEAVKWGPLEVGDVTDRVRLREVMARHRPAAVVHFAALAYVGESNENPAAYYRNNVGGTAALLESIREAIASIDVALRLFDPNATPEKLGSRCSVCFENCSPRPVVKPG